MPGPPHPRAMRRPLPALPVLLACVLVLAALPGVAAAETLVGGTVTVAEDDEISGDVSATGRTVVVRGTVDGDLRAYGGDVRIAEGAEVTGILRVYGGDVRVDGAVGGNALIYGGDVTLGETGSVDRSFGAVAGDVTIAGTVGGGANVLAGTVTLAESSVVDGGLTYQGKLADEGGTVAGATLRTQDLALVPPLEPILAVASALLLLANLLLGGILLSAAPRFADAATRMVVSEPVRTGVTGLAAVVGTLLVAGLLAVTVIGIPLAVALLLVGTVLAWVASVYGRFVLGHWLLTSVGVDDRYLGLLAGVVLVALLGLVPYLGFVVRTGVFLLGGGVVALGARRLYDVVARDHGGLADV